MLHLYLISLLILAAYTAYAVKVCGVPWSLSDTYYQLQKRNRPAWLFQAATIISAILLLPVWLESSPEDVQFLAFLSCGGLIFVGTAPLFKEESEKRVHYGGTIVSAVSAISWLCCVEVWYLPVATLLIAVAVMVKRKKWMFWIEMAVLVSTYAGVGIKLVETLYKQQEV